MFIKRKINRIVFCCLQILNKDYLKHRYFGLVLNHIDKDDLKHENNTIASPNLHF